MTNEELINKLIADRLRGGQPVESVPNAAPNKAPKVVDPVITTGVRPEETSPTPAKPSKDFYFLYENVPDGVETEVVSKEIDGKIRKVRQVKGVATTPALVGAGQAVGANIEAPGIEEVDWGEVGSQYEVGQAQIQRGLLASKEAASGKLGKEDQAEFERLSKFIEDNQVIQSTALWGSMVDPIEENGVFGVLDTVNNVAKGVAAMFSANAPHLAASAVSGYAGGAAGGALGGPVGATVGAAASMWSASSALYTTYNLASQKEKIDGEGGEYNIANALIGGGISGALDIGTVGLIKKTPFLGKYIDYLIPGTNTVAAPVKKELSKSLTKRAADRIAVIGGITAGAGVIEGAQELADYYGGDNNGTILGTLQSEEAWNNASEAAIVGGIFGFLGGGVGTAVDVGLKARKGKPTEIEKLVPDTNEINTNEDDLYKDYGPGTSEPDQGVSPTQTETIEDILIRGSKKKDTIKNFENIYKDAKSDVNRLDTKGVKIFNLKDKEALYNQPEFLEDFYKTIDTESRKEVPDTESIFGNSPNVINDSEFVIFDERVDDIFNSVLTTNERFKAAVEKDPSKKLQLFQQVTNGIKESRRKAEAAIKAVQDPQSPVRTKILEAYESSFNNPIRRRLINDLAKTLPMIDKNPLVGHLMSDQTLLDMKAAIDSGKYKQQIQQNKQQKLDNLEAGILFADNNQKVLSDVFKSYVDANYRPSNPLKVFDEIADVAVRAATRPKQDYEGKFARGRDKADPVTGLPINTATQLITNRVLESNEYLKEIAGDAGVDYIRNRIITNLKAIKRDKRKGGPQVDPNKPINGEGVTPGGFEGIWDKDLDAWLDGAIADEDNRVVNPDPLDTINDGTVKPVTPDNNRPRVDTVGLGKFYAVFPEEGIATDIIEASDDYGRFESGNRPENIKEIELDDLQFVSNLDTEIDVMEFLLNWTGDKPNLVQLKNFDSNLFKAPLKVRTATANDFLDFLATLSPDNASLVDAVKRSGNGSTFTDRATGEKRYVFNPANNTNLSKFKDSVFPVDIETAQGLKNIKNVTGKATQLFPGASAWDAPENRVTENFDPSKDIQPTSSNIEKISSYPFNTFKRKFKNPQVEFIAKQSTPVFNSFIRAILGKKGFDRTFYLPVGEAYGAKGLYFPQEGVLLNSFSSLDWIVSKGDQISWKDFRNGPLRTFFHELFHAADYQNIIPEQDRQIILRDRDKIIDWGNNNKIWDEFTKAGMNLGQFQTDIELPAYTFMEYALQRIEKGLIKNGKVALDKDQFSLEDFWNELDKAWKAGGTSPVANIPSPTLRRIFEGIYEGLVQFRKWLSGQGVNSWTDVYDNLLSGEYGKRADKAKLVFTIYPETLLKGRVATPLSSPVAMREVSKEQLVRQIVENDLIKQTEQTTVDYLNNTEQQKALNRLISRTSENIRGPLQQFATRARQLIYNSERAPLNLTGGPLKTWLMHNLASSVGLSYRGVSLEMLARRDEDAAKVLEFGKSFENLARKILHSLHPVASKLKESPWFKKSFAIALDLRKRNVSLNDVNPDGSLSFKDSKGVTRTLPPQEVQNLRDLNAAFSLPLYIYSELAWSALGRFAGQISQLQDVIKQKDPKLLKDTVADLIQANKEYPDGTRLSNAELRMIRDLSNNILEYNKHLIGGKVYVPEMRFGNRAIAVYSTKATDKQEFLNQTDPDLRLQDDVPPKKVLVGLFMSEPEGAFERELNPKRMKEREQKLRNDVLKKYNPKDGYEVTEAFDMTNDALGRSIKASDMDMSMLASFMSNKLSGMFDGRINIDPSELKENVQNHITVQGFNKHLVKSRHIDGASTDADRVLESYFNSASYGAARAAHGPMLSKLSADIEEKKKTDPDLSGKWETLQEHLKYSTDEKADYAQFRTFGFLWALAGNVSTAFLQLHSNVVMVPMIMARYGLMDPLTALKTFRPTVAYFIRVAAQDAKALNEGRKTRKTKGYFETFDPAFFDETLDPFLARFKDKEKIKYFKNSIQDNSTFINPSLVDEGRSFSATKSRGARMWERFKLSAGYMLQRMEQSARMGTYVTTLDTLYGRPAKVATILSDLNENPKFREMRVNNRNLDDINAIAAFFTSESFGSSNKISRPGYNRQWGSLLTPFTSLPGQMFETWFDVIIGQGKGKLTDKSIAAAYAVLMTVALGGAAGYPFYELLTTLIEKLVDADAPGELQLKKFFGDLTGSPLAGDVLARGALRALLGVDIAQRVAMQPGWQDPAMLALNAFFLDKEPQLRDVGILGGFGTSFMALKQNIQSSGLDSEKTKLAAINALPAALRNAALAAEYMRENATDGVIRNAKGTPILPASELEVSDIYAKLLGFQPVEIQNANIMQYGKNLSSRVNEQAKTALLDELAALDRRKAKGLPIDNSKRDALISEYYRLSGGRSKQAKQSLGRGLKTRLLASQNPNDPKVTTPGQEQFLSTFKDYIKISE